MADEKKSLGLCRDRVSFGGVMAGGACEDGSVEGSFQLTDTR